MGSCLLVEESYWDLLFGLFKRIVRNVGDFCIKQVYGFLFFSLKRTKLYLRFDRDLLQCHGTYYGNSTQTLPSHGVVTWMCHVGF